MYCLLVVMGFAVSTCAIDCLERLVSKVAHHMLNGTIFAHFRFCLVSVAIFHVLFFLTKASFV